MVIDRGAFLAGEYRPGLRRDRAREGGVRRGPLKMILETGELADYDHVRKACRIALLAGTDS